MMVRFASICDTCDRRSEEYTQWPQCRECGDHACPQCAQPGTLEEGEGNYEDGEERGHGDSVLCATCAEDSHD